MSSDGGEEHKRRDADGAGGGEVGAGDGTGGGQAGAGDVIEVLAALERLAGASAERARVNVEREREKRRQFVREMRAGRRSDAPSSSFHFPSGFRAALLARTHLLPGSCALFAPSPVRARSLPPACIGFSMPQPAASPPARADHYAPRASRLWAVVVTVVTSCALPSRGHRRGTGLRAQRILEALALRVRTEAALEDATVEELVAVALAMQSSEA